jgi:hypothetical protein
MIDFKDPQFDRSVILLVRAVVFGQWAELPETRGDDGGARRRIRASDNPSLGSPLFAGLLLRFNLRERAVTGSWHVDETYNKVRSRSMYLYRAIDSHGNTVEFYLLSCATLPPPNRVVERAFARQERPERIVIDGSQTNREAVMSCDTTNRLRDRSRRRLKPIRIRQSQYLRDIFDKPLFSVGANLIWHG